MAENIPPATVAANGANGGAAGPGTAEQIQSRGLPYYEKLRRELRETLQKKRVMDKNMAALEESIYRFEQSYLEETGAGNIIKGFDNYIKGSSGGSGIGAGSSLGSMTAGGGGGGGGPTTRRKTQVQDSDRVFSKSSASFMRDSPAPSSTHTTPSHAPTPTSSHPPGAHRDTNNKDTAANNNASAASSVKGGGGGGSGIGGSNNKKKKNPTAATDSSARGRERERDEDDEESAGGGGNNKGTVKRLKITYARD
ncbi:hypothetical protein FQN53_004423 [Emmonsiellopsis sp. PD_33]|nr:hypothetical protein FQN53_004423 [Emmonsiellopsis sp. PD_33]